MQSSLGNVVSLFDITSIMVLPWLNAGYRCYCYDIQHPWGMHKEGNLIRVGCDLRNEILMPKEVKIIFGFPPCTNLSASGARWYKEKGLRSLGESILLVARCVELCEKSKAPWMIENPISTLSTYWRKPDFKFDPCDFGGYLDPIGDQYTKQTCLWVGNGFNIPALKQVVPEGSKMHLLSLSIDRAYLRSKTPQGFAQAVFEANHTEEK